MYTYICILYTYIYIYIMISIGSQENTEMLLGDAKKTSDSLAAMVKERLEKV